jgi:hypothetical protein
MIDHSNFMEPRIVDIEKKKTKIRYFNQLDYRTAMNIYKIATILEYKYIEVLSTKTFCHLSIRDLADDFDVSYKKISSDIRRAKLLIMAAITKHISSTQYEAQLDVKVMYKEILTIYFYDLYEWNEIFSISRDSLISEEETEYYEHQIDEILSAYSF